MKNIFLKFESLAGVSNWVGGKKTYSTIIDIAFDICRWPAEQWCLKSGFSLKGYNKIIIICWNVAALESYNVPVSQQLSFFGLVKVADSDSIGITAVIKGITADKPVVDGIGQ